MLRAATIALACGGASAIPVDGVITQTLAELKEIVAKEDRGVVTTQTFAELKELVAAESHANVTSNVTSHSLIQGAGGCSTAQTRYDQAQAAADAASARAATAAAAGDAAAAAAHQAAASMETAAMEAEKMTIAAEAAMEAATTDTSIAAAAAAEGAAAKAHEMAANAEATAALLEGTSTAASDAAAAAEAKANEAQVIANRLLAGVSNLCVPSPPPSSPPPPAAAFATSFGGRHSGITNFAVSAGGWSSYNTYPRMIGDVNGDKKDDVVGFGADHVFVSLATGTGFSAPTSWIKHYTPSQGGWIDQNTYPRMVGDVDGDGKADLVAFGYAGVYVGLSTGTGFAPGALWISNFAVGAGGWSSFDKYPRTVADVNGDGKADIIGFGADHTFVALSTGTGFSAPTSWVKHFTVNQGGWATFDKYPRIVSDVDGDGKADLVAFGHAGVYTSLSTGTAFAAAGATIPTYTNFAFGAGGWTSYNSFPRKVKDVNGDGKADIVGFGLDYTFVALAPSTGTGAYGAATSWVQHFTPNQGGWTTNDMYPRTIGDVDGGGKGDIVAFGSAATYISLAQ